jgi:hypothetical protein
MQESVGNVNGEIHILSQLVLLSVLGLPISHLHMDDVVFFGFYK